MELTRINELMANRGYAKPIGAIFSNWEFVKDEILLPNRKAGSGNGTVHVYLLEDNMPLFRECFPEYIQAVDGNSSDAEELCPKVKHFVLTSNVLTVAGFAYHHYNCDANIFNYSDYVGKVMRHDDNGMMTFESVFKLSTENRPYFKQFDKQVFGKIIRYIFVPRKTAYKLYLYSDDEYQHFAAFWIIGQIPNKAFIVDVEYNGKPMKVELPVEKAEEPETKEEKKQEIIILATPEDVEARFIKYMKSLRKSERTVKSYASNLRNLIPRALKIVDGQNHPSPYTITDIEHLRWIDKEVFGNPEVAKWNSLGHNRASAALHMYMSMFEDKFTDDTAPSVAVKQPKPKEDVHRMDFTLADDEQAQMEHYSKYLKNEKGMAEITRNSYVNILLKRMSNLLRDHYRSDFRNIFTIDNYKVLMKMDDEIWKIPEIVEANNKSKGKLSASFRAYMDFVESTLSDDELAEIMFADTEDSVRNTELSIFSTVGKLQQYTTHLPLYTLSAACGKFADDEDVEMEGWVNVKDYGIKASSDMFIVHAKGHSMEPRISDGDLCVFRMYQGGSRNGSIVLTQLTSRDSDYCGMYTIKKYYSEKKCDEYGVVQHTKVELQSLNPDYDNIEITEEDANEIKTVGIFVDTLK